jgi:cell division septation protein DedD
MAENRKDAENGQYYVSKTQVVVVATGFAATCALIFLLGILVGQGIEERKLLKQEEPLVKVPFQPLAPGAKSGPGAPAKDELTFYDTLAKAPAAAPPSAKEPVKEAKAAEKTAKTPDVQPAKEPIKDAKPAEKAPRPAAQETKESQAEAKESQEAKPATKEIKTAKANVAAEAPAQKTKENGEKSAPTENGKNGKPEAAPEPAPTAKAAQETPKVAQETPKAAQETPKAAPKAAPEAAPKAAPKAAPEAAPKTAPKAAQEEKAKPDAAGRVWAVQVNAYPEEGRAQKMVERLKEKGYDAYVVTANIKGKDWYRVRVGHFGARSQVKELLEEIQTKENFPKAIAVSR